LEAKMSLPTIDTVRGWQNLTLVASDGTVIGPIGSIYIDRDTRQPEWMLVGVDPGSARTFVPIQDAIQEGDTVRVPHQEATIRNCPDMDPDGDLSEDEEARLYNHYGVEYSTAASPSGLPAGEAEATTAAGARGRLTRDAPAAAAGDAETVTPEAAAGEVPSVVITAAGRRDVEDTETVGPTGTQPQLEAVPSGTTGVTAAEQRQAGRGRLVRRLAGAGTAAAVGSVMLRRRRARRRPQGLAAALVALGLARSRRRRRVTVMLRRQPRRRRMVAVLGRQPRPRLVVAVLGRRPRPGRMTTVMSGAGQAVGGGRTAARQAGQTLGLGAGAAARGVGQQMGAVRRRVGGRPAAPAGRAKATALVTAAAATSTLRRLRRRRNRARARQRAARQLAGVGQAWAWLMAQAGRAGEQAAEASRQAASTAAGAAESARGAPAAATRKLRRQTRRAGAGRTAGRAEVKRTAGRTGRQLRESVPRRQRRSKRMGSKVTGRLGLVFGAAAGYVLGTKAGRERYEQIVQTARQLTEKPQVRRVVEQAPSTVTSTVGQVADKAADKVRQAGDKVAAGSSGGTGRNNASQAPGPVVDVRAGEQAGGTGRRGVEDPVPSPAPVPAAPKTGSKAPNPAPEEIGRQ
jgi:hypothetical protein